MRDNQIAATGNVCQVLEPRHRVIYGITLPSSTEHKQLRQYHNDGEAFTLALNKPFRLFGDKGQHNFGNLVTDHRKRRHEQNIWITSAFVAE